MSQLAERPPLIRTAGHDYRTVTAKIAAVVLRPRTGIGWLGLIATASLLVLVLLIAVMWLFVQGVGIWGIRIPIAWGFAITNFVWWIGIGHAGTLISAILLLLHQKWRTSINRFAEAMTLFAVLCAALFPLLHLGRPQLFYWLAPYPNTMDLWPQFRSALVWDMFAVATYFTVSLLFWYLGLVPDAAAMRDRAETRGWQRFYGVLALGWRGSARHWRHYRSAYLMLAGLATPLVVSVHSIVSLDFAISIVPGWHSTIFPPYFVAGAIFSGMALVLTLAIPMRRAFGWQDLVTERHLDNMAKVTLVTGLIVAYGYLAETFVAWYSDNRYEAFTGLEDRFLGPQAWTFWLVLFCNCVALQLLWVQRVRRSAAWLFALSLVFQVGMWTERYTIVVLPLQRDYLPSAWNEYVPTVWDCLTFAGTMGLFLLLYLLLLRLVPAVSMHEVRELLHETSARATVAEARPAERALPERRGPPWWGLLASFRAPEQLLEAVRAARARGLRHLDAHAPWPVEGLDAALGLRRSRVPALTLVGALCGAAGAYVLQWIPNVLDYPMNVGGKPDHSWPSFVPITFEGLVFGGAVGAVLGVLGFCRLPRPHHALFAVPDFERATQDRFFLSIRDVDGDLDWAAARELLAGLGPERVIEVPA